MLFRHCSFKFTVPSISNSAHLLSTVCKVHHILHILWTNILLSVTLQVGKYDTVPLCTFHVNLYVHVVWCDTLWTWKVVCGNTVNNCMCLSCAMVQSMWHTASTYRSTRSVGWYIVPSCPHCTGVPFIPHLPYSENGHWKTSDANIEINGYHEWNWLRW